MSLIDHIAIGVADLDASRDFFLAALAPLGVRVVMEAPRAAGLGLDGPPFLWLDAKLEHVPPMHLAFAAENRALVDAFHRCALAAGATDNGPPGIRSHYGPSYYAAFVTSPDGHNIEVVCRAATRAHA